MSLELSTQIGLLVAAMVTAFAISSLVGILVARLWVGPHPLSGAPYEPGLRPSRSDPVREEPTGRRPAETLGGATGPVA